MAMVVHHGMIKHLAKARKLDGELHPHGDQGLLGTAEMAINSHDLLNNDDFNLNFCKLPHHSVNAMRGIEIQKAIQGKTVFIKLFFNGGFDLNDSIGRPPWKLDADEMLKKSAL